MVIDGIHVTADESLTNEEIVHLVLEEKQQWQKQKRVLARVELTLDGDDIIVKAVEKSPIRRIRRITGYLSNLDNFNEAKLAECKTRVVHGI